MKKYSSNICFILVFLITIYPFHNLWAKPNHPLRIGVVAITDLTEEETKFSRDLNSQLGEQGFFIIQPQEISKAIQILSDTVHQKNLTLMSNQSQDDYFQGNFYSTSQASLEKLLKDMNTHPGTCGDEKPLAASAVVDAYITMGLIHLAQKQTKKAFADFNAAHTINPHLTLTDAQYSPSVIGFYNQVIKNAPVSQTDPSSMVKQSALLVSSSPANAQVFVDGQLKGHTPFKLPALDGSSHILTIQAEGLAPYCQTLLGSSEKHPDISVTLTSKPEATQVNTAYRPFNPASLAQNVSQSSLFSNLLDADQLILLGHLTSAKTQKQVLTTRIYQAHSSFLGSEHVLERSGNITQQTAQIVSQLKDTPYVKLYEAETETKAGDTPDKPAVKKAHSGKSVLFIVGGILVAGAAAGIALGMGGGGGGGGSQPAASSSVSISAPQPQ